MRYQVPQLWMLSLVRYYVDAMSVQRMKVSVSIKPFLFYYATSATSFICSNLNSQIEDVKEVYFKKTQEIQINQIIVRRRRNMRSRFNFFIEFCYFVVIFSRGDELPLATTTAVIFLLVWLVFQENFNLVIYFFSLDLFFLI